MIASTDIVAAIVDAVAATVGYDFTATDAVKVGVYTEPPMAVPFACVYVASPAESTGFARERRQRVALRVTIDAWVAFEEEQPDDRSDAALGVANAIKVAIMTGRFSGASDLSKAWQLTVSDANPRPSSTAEAPTFARASLTVEVVYLTASGV